MADFFSFHCCVFMGRIIRFKFVSKVGLRTDVPMLKHVEIKIFTNNDISVEILNPVTTHIGTNGPRDTVNGAIPNAPVYCLCL